MASRDDETRELLEKLVSDLYGVASKNLERIPGGHGSSFLRADDNQFLGKITENSFDTDSILNQYGPYGSQYSSTSIFNPYCQYGGQYGRFSPENPYTTTPPSLIINGQEIGKVSANRVIPKRIPFDVFIYSLRNDIRGLLRGSINRDEVVFHQKTGDAYIQAANGAFLGNLNPNKLDVNSIFNPYGEFGNKFSSNSIFNKFSEYGGRYSMHSPYNPTSSNPPKIIVNGVSVAYLTVNLSLTPSIHPDKIMQWAEENVRRRFG